ncbi:MAG: zinc ribbon domain-containing protein [Clostridia bacterium]|nr:zinc ribbon domain-containing protein [Clostridia bacterium]
MTYSADSNTPHLCRYCGKPVTGRFCTGCGTPVDDTAPVQPVQPPQQAIQQPIAPPVGVKRPLWRLISDIMLFVAILLLCLAPFVGFLRQATIMGTSATYSQSLGLFDYLFSSKTGAMIPSFEAAINSLENMGAGSVDEVMSSLGGVMTIYSNVFVAGTAISTFFISFIGIIVSIVRFCKKKSHKLSIQVFKAMASIFSSFMLLSFFASISGGTGDNAYYIGYEIAPETTGAFIAAFVLTVGAMVVNFLFNRKQVWESKRVVFLKNASIFVGFSLIAILLLTIRGYKLFSSSFSSLLTTLAGTISNGFSISTILFPVLNLLLFVLCLTMFTKAKNAVSSSGLSLLYAIYAGEGEAERLKVKVVEPKTKHISEIVIASLAIISIIVLKIPSIGYGWSVAIFEQLVGILLISALIWIANAFVDGAFGATAATTAPVQPAPQSVPNGATPSDAPVSPQENSNNS